MSSCDKQTSSILWYASVTCRFNAVDSIETFVSDINNGRWEVILPQVAVLKLPRAKLKNINEQACRGAGLAS